MISRRWKIHRIKKVMKLIIKTTEGYKTEGFEHKDHEISIIDCLNGFRKALIHFDTLKLELMDVNELVWYEKPINGDLNWIIPGKIMASAGPCEEGFRIENFLEYIKKHGVGCVIRLNREMYDKGLLEAEGIEHEEMFFRDGTIPNHETVQKFIKVVGGSIERGRGVAVHCRAGLGRTGTLISAFILWKMGRDHGEGGWKECNCMKDRQKTAREIIGFMRIMRPGSVLGRQPEFLEQVATEIMEAGNKKDITLINYEREADQGGINKTLESPEMKRKLAKGSSKKRDQSRKKRDKW